MVAVTLGENRELVEWRKFYLNGASTSALLAWFAIKLDYGQEEKMEKQTPLPKIFFLFLFSRGVFVAVAIVAALPSSWSLTNDDRSANDNVTNQWFDWLNEEK